MDKDIKYLILGNDWDLYLFSWSDVFGMENVTYIPGRFPKRNSLKGILYRIHFNKYIPLPLKGIWNSTYVPGSIKRDDIFFVIVLDCWMCPEGLEVLDYIRKTYKRAKIVWQAQDLIRFSLARLNVREDEFYKLRKKFNLIISFDPGDCAKYSLEYHPLRFSSFKDPILPMQCSDVYFLGKAKDRFGEIIGVYNLLRLNGIRCDFNIIGVKKEDQVNIEGLNYINGMPYKQNLQHVIHTKCILELMQSGGKGYTQRVLEAVCLKKKF